jgi:hypothetical protein
MAQPPERLTEHYTTFLVFQIFTPVLAEELEVRCLGRPTLETEEHPQLQETTATGNF